MYCFACSIDWFVPLLPFPLPADSLRIFAHLKKLVKLLRSEDKLRMVSVWTGTRCYGNHCPGGIPRKMKAIEALGAHLVK